MNLHISILPAFFYTSTSQMVRVATEDWAAENLYCASCAGTLIEYGANTKTRDFRCAHCQEEFQLKSTTKGLKRSLSGAEYSTTLRSISGGCHPSMILLRYELSSMEVKEVQIVHRRGITSACVSPRKPLSASARRAGWQGCIYLLDQMPPSVRIDVVKNGTVVPQDEVMMKWQVAAGPSQA
jgi:type II restriction enzyme